MKTLTCTYRLELVWNCTTDNKAATPTKTGGRKGVALTQSINSAFGHFAPFSFLSSNDSVVRKRRKERDEPCDD